MTNQTHNSAADTMTDAAEWYWKIRDPDVSESEIRQWQDWLAARAGHREAFSRIENALEGVSRIEAPPWPTEEELLQDRYDGTGPVAEWLRSARSGKSAARSSSRGAWFRRRRVWAAAASIAIAGGLAVWFAGSIGRDGRLPDVAAYETVAAEHKDVMLPDGSSISLGGKTRVSVAYGPDFRSIELQEGEAFFDVASDPRRPFEVIAGGRRIVAVGTSFNVARQAARVTVTVTEGKVVVERQPESPAASTGSGPGKPAAAGRVARLEAGQQIVFDRDEIEPISFTSAADALAWRSGMLKYRREKLSYVIEDVRRYTRQPIVVIDDAVAGLSFTGTVFQDSTESWVYALEDAFPVEVSRSPDGIMIRSRSR